MLRTTWSRSERIQSVDMLKLPDGSKIGYTYSVYDISDWYIEKDISADKLTLYVMAEESELQTLPSCLISVIVLGC